MAESTQRGNASRPTIATLVPSYNAARYIGEALDSVAAQTCRPDEVVVVDDGSTDVTMKVVKKWAADNPTINLRSISQPNRGASAARNAAIRAVKTDLIAFLDADDVLEPRHHELLSMGLARHSEITAIFGDQSVFAEHGEHSASFLTGKPIEKISAQKQADGLRVLNDGLWGGLIQGNFIPTSGSMTWRRLAIDVGLFDTELRMSEDRDFWLRISRLGGFAYIPERVARKREHEFNLTGDTNAALVKQYSLEVVLKQLRRAAKLQLTEEELISTREAAKHASTLMLYSASLAGLATYRGSRRHLASRAPEYLTLDLPGWARAIVHSLRANCKVKRQT